MARTEGTGAQARAALAQMVDHAGGRQPDRQPGAREAQRILGVVVGQEEGRIGQAGAGNGVPRYQEADEGGGIGAARRSGIGGARQRAFESAGRMVAAPVAQGEVAELAHRSAQRAGAGGRPAGGLEQPGQGVRARDRIVVQQPDPVMAGDEGLAHAEGEAAGAAEVGVRPDQADRRRPAGAVGAGVAAIVDQQDGVERPALPAQRRQHPGQQGRPAMGHDDGGDAHASPGSGGGRGAPPGGAPGAGSGAGRTAARAPTGCSGRPGAPCPCCAGAAGSARASRRRARAR